MRMILLVVTLLLLALLLTAIGCVSQYEELDEGPVAVTSAQALTWISGPPPNPDTDPRVNYSSSSAGFIRLECYAFEPLEDVYYFDVIVSGVAGLRTKLTNMKSGGTTTPACQRLAHREAAKHVDLTRLALQPVPN